MSISLKRSKSVIATSTPSSAQPPGTELHEQLQLLRAGKHPEVVRSAVSRRHGILGKIKSIAGNL
jgi:hypothetical protein